MSEETFELLAKLIRLSELLHRHSHRSHRMHGPVGDPHRGQGRVLALLRMRPEISQKELSYLLDIRPQSLGELLAKLERNGFIERAPSETDRRVMNIRLTEEGEKAAEQPREGDALFKSLNAEEQELLGQYLDRIIAELEEDLADEPAGPEDGPHGRHGRPPHPHHGPHGPHGPGHGPEHRPPHPPHHHRERGERHGFGPGCDPELAHGGHGHSHDRRPDMERGWGHPHDSGEGCPE